MCATPCWENKIAKVKFVFRRSDRSTMSKLNVDISFLNELVNETLYSTEEVKKILQAECNDARDVLRTCPIETVITKEIDEQCCTCNSKSSLENHAHEIVEGIGKALAQAQELREKAANNVAKHRQKTREPDVETIYTAHNRNVQKKSKTLSDEKKSIKTVNSKTSKTSASKEELSNVKKSEVTATKSAEFESETAAEKIPVRCSNNAIPSSNTEKLKRKKNFLAVNKANIKNMKRDQKSTSNPKPVTDILKRSSDLSPLSGTSETLSSCTNSIAKLNDLMRKVSVEATEKSSSTCLDSTNCPVHNESASKIITQKVRSTVDLMEGLDRFGIQGNLVRIFKIYHSYINKEVSTNQSDDKRCQRAADKFLAEFHVMNDNREAEEKSCIQLEHLIVGYQSILRGLHNQLDFNDEQTNKIINRYAELDFAGKTSQLRKFDPAKFRQSRKAGLLEKHHKYSRSWSANGVWNRLSPDCFPNVTGIPCIRYANKSQLSSFFELNQRLQLFSYHQNLLDLLVDKVLPSVLKNFHTSSSEYCEAYKMIFIIAQVLNPRIPTLVRTDV